MLSLNGVTSTKNTMSRYDFNVFYRGNCCFRQLQVVRKSGGTVKGFGQPGILRGMGLTKVCQNRSMDTQMCCCEGYFGPNCDQSECIDVFSHTCKCTCTRTCRGLTWPCICMFTYNSGNYSNHPRF